MVILCFLVAFLDGSNDGEIVVCVCEWFRGKKQGLGWGELKPGTLKTPLTALPFALLNLHLPLLFTTL